MKPENVGYAPEPEFVDFTLQQLKRENPLLRPDKLTSVIKEFDRFIPYRKMLGMWSSLEYHGEHGRLAREKADGTDFKVGLVNFAGIFAGGKNTLANVINKQKPSFWEFAVSATSRDIRMNEDGQPVETDGVDYHFRSGEWFAKRKAEGKLLNHVRIGADIDDPPEKGTWYAFPSVSLEKAWEKSTLSYVHITIDEWQNFQSEVERVFVEKSPLFLTIHMWPEMRFLDYIQHLKENRPQDHERRTHAAVRELLFAAKEAQVVLVNRFGEGNEAEVLKQTRASAVVNFISSHFAHILELSNPYGWVDEPAMSPGIGATPDVLSVQRQHEKKLID